MLTPWPEDIGRAARQRRVDLGLSQEDLAERAGVTRQWISRFEQAKADVSLAKGMQVLRELGLIVDVAPRTAPKAGESLTRASDSPPRIRSQVTTPGLSSEMLAKMNKVIRSSTDTTRLSHAAELALRRLKDTGSLPGWRHPLPVEKRREEEL